MPTNVNLGYETAVREHVAVIDPPSQARREAAAKKESASDAADAKESK